MRHNIRVDLQDVDASEAREFFRSKLRELDDNPLTTWRWWSGFLCGCVLIAAMNYGDVHLCVGSCGDAEIRVGAD